MCEGIVFHIGVEVGSIGETNGVGGGPPTYSGVVVASAKVDPAGFEVEAFAGEVPGVYSSRSIALFFAKGAVDIAVRQGIGRAIDEQGNVTGLVMDRDVDLTF